MRRSSLFAVALAYCLVVPVAAFSQDAVVCTASAALAQCRGSDCARSDAVGEGTANDESTAKQRALDSCFESLTQRVAEADVSTVLGRCVVSTCASRTAEAH